MQPQLELERFTQDAVWVDEHQEELLNAYNNRWIAVYNREVVGSARDIARLIRQLQRKGISPAHAYRRYLTDREELLIVFSIRS